MKPDADRSDMMEPEESSGKDHAMADGEDAHETSLQETHEEGHLWESTETLGRLALEQEQSRQQSLKHEAEVLLVAVPLVALGALAAGVAAAESLSGLAHEFLLWALFAEGIVAAASFIIAAVSLMGMKAAPLGTPQEHLRVAEGRLRAGAGNLDHEAAELETEALGHALDVLAEEDGHRAVLMKLALSFAVASAGLPLAAALVLLILHAVGMA